MCGDKNRNNQQHALKSLDSLLLEVTGGGEEHSDTRVRESLLTLGVGTPRYMAPENALSSSYGPPADVYSAALVTWAACSRKQPFRDLDSKEHARRVIGGDLRPPSLGNPVLDALLARAWAPDPASRPDAAAFADGLAEVLVELRFGELPPAP